MHTLEKELVEATEFNGKKHKKRSEYLAALTKACNDLPDDEFDNLSDEAADWVNKAAAVLKKGKGKIEDFPEEEEAEAEEESEDEDETESEESEDETESEDEDETESEDEDESEDEPEEDEPEEDEDEKPAKKGKVKDEKPSKKAKAEEKPAKKAKDEKPERREKKKGPHEYKNAKRDRYGLVEGSKVSDAVKLFEKGAPMKVIKEKCGGPQNNVLKKLAKAGHLVEKFDGVIKVTHKDDVKGKKASKPEEAKPSKKDKAKEAEKPASKKADKGKSSKRKPAEEDDDD